jgi:hypothetical protein
MIDRIAALAKQIQTSTPDANVDFTAFPSGSAMLDVRRGGHLYVLSFSPMHRFGVDEVNAGEGFLTGYQFASNDFEPAAERLLELVASAEVAEKVRAEHP